MDTPVFVLDSNLHNVEKHYFKTTINCRRKIKCVKMCYNHPSLTIHNIEGIQVKCALVVSPSEIIYKLSLNIKLLCANVCNINENILQAAMTGQAQHWKNEQPKKHDDKNNNDNNNNVDFDAIFMFSCVICVLYVSSDRTLTKVSLGTKIDRLHCQRKCFHISLNNLQIVVSQ